MGTNASCMECRSHAISGIIFWDVTRNRSTCLRWQMLRTTQRTSPDGGPNVGSQKELIETMFSTMLLASVSRIRLRTAHACRSLLKMKIPIFSLQKLLFQVSCDDVIGS